MLYGYSGKLLVLTLKGICEAVSFRTPSDKDTAAPSGRAAPAGRASQAQAHIVSGW